MKVLCEIVLVLTVLEVASGTGGNKLPNGFNREADGYEDVVYGYDCPGNTIAEYSDRRLRKCAKTCRDDPQCVAFVLDRTSGADHCVIKSACETKEKKEDFGIFIKESACEAGWLKYDGSCYLFVKDQSKTWSDAQAYCQTQQATLVVLETRAEMEFVEAQIRALMGNTDQYWWLWGSHHTDGKWYWDDSTEMVIPLSSDLWFPGEPNSANENHLDIIVRNGQFGINDANEAARLHFVCMRY